MISRTWASRFFEKIQALRLVPEAGSVSGTQRPQIFKNSSLNCLVLPKTAMAFGLYSTMWIVSGEGVTFLRGVAGVSACGVGTGSGAGSGVGSGSGSGTGAGCGSGVCSCSGSGWVSVSAGKAGASSEVSETGDGAVLWVGKIHSS